MEIEPLFDRVLIQPEEAINRTKCEMYLTDRIRGNFVRGTVVAVGPGARNNNGEYMATVMKVGDQVLLPEQGGTKVELGNEEFYLYRETDIIARLHELP